MDLTDQWIATAPTMLVAGLRRSCKRHTWNDNGFGLYATDDWFEFVASVRALGVTEPLMVWLEPGNGALLAEGNHRIEAALQAGVAEVPVDVRVFERAPVLPWLRKQVA